MSLCMTLDYPSFSEWDTLVKDIGHFWGRDNLPWHAESLTFENIRLLCTGMGLLCMQKSPKRDCNLGPIMFLRSRC
jgi:hypothetical protein